MQEALLNRDTKLKILMSACTFFQKLFMYPLNFYFDHFFFSTKDVYLDFFCYLVTYAMVGYKVKD